MFAFKFINMHLIIKKLQHTQNGNQNRQRNTVSRKQMRIQVMVTSMIWYVWLQVKS
jgi:hypothetical protein